LRSVVRVLCVLALLVGAVWIGQGIGLIPGSFMTGRLEWALAGGGLVAAALVVLWLGPRRPADGSG
jgi:hypothetical protein